MHFRRIRWTQGTPSPGMGVVAMFLLLLGLCVAAVTPASASGGGPSVTSARANLQHSPTGTASLSLDTAAQTLTVQMRLVGLAPKSLHPAHIHLNSCESTGPEVIQDMLTPVSADANGQGISTTVLHGMRAIPASGWFLSVHNGPGASTDIEKARIACAAVVNPAGSSSVNATFGPTADPNEHASGSAELRITNQGLIVSLKVSGLVPNSIHAAHIHAGDCTNSGQVLYDLSPLIADANGQVVKTVTFPGVSSIPASGWDINVHNTTDLSTQTGYNPILCGNVVPE